MRAARSNSLPSLQNEILEAVAYGERLDAIADRLCRRVEDMAPAVISSILVVDAEGVVHPLSAPSLPSHYSQALEGLRVGPCAGSCGTAAYRGEPVEVTDIATDPLWADYRALAIPLGLQACWSSPIKARDGRVVGTFAFYYRSKRGPDELERLIVKTCVHLCAIAIEHEEVRARNHQLAFYDTLTGLPNRGHFDAMIRERLAGPRKAFGLLLIDIDHLKSINDTMGHAAGDALIRHVASHISQDIARGRACRLGGDEFAVLLDGCGTPGAMRAVALRLLGMKNTPFQFGDHSIVPHVTIGGALYGEDGGNADTLRQNADFALYHAKEMNRGGYVHFNEGLRTAITRRIRTIRDVDEALADDRILAYYQPVVRLDTAAIVGLEALARMRANDGRIVSAGEFHQAMTDPKVAHRLTGQMLREVASDLRSWVAADIRFQHVGINVSTADFQKSDLEGRITEAFGEAGVPLKHVILEVTESVFMGGGDNMVAKAVKRLRAKGLLVALDDFGTGFASLTHLLSFPVDIIKIDKSFVDRLLTDRPSEVIVESLIDIARKLDMRVIAEGIETVPQAERLRELGCTLGQGYLFARPASASTTTRLLQVFAQRPHATHWADLPASTTAA